MIQAYVYCEDPTDVAILFSPDCEKRLRFVRCPMKKHKSDPLGL